MPRCVRSNPNEDRIGAQILFCERLAEQRGFTIVKRFSDLNRSCFSAQRQGYQDMLLGARQHEFDAIFAEDIDRFSRDQAEVMSLLAELDGLGIAVLTEYFDSRDKTYNPFLTIYKDASDAMKRREHSLRIKRGLEGRRIKRMEDSQ